MFVSFLNGAILSFSLIIAIGAQNVFVLQQGLMKNHIFVVCFICFVCDAILMACGIFGIGGVFAKNENLSFWLGVCGILFLLAFGLNAFISSFRGSNFAKIKNAIPQKLSKTALKTLAVTLLNPHVYLDTVVIVGGIGTTLNLQERIYFWLGSVLASFIWFFSLGYGAMKLSKLFMNAKAWRIIDFVVGIFMFYIAFLLIRFILKI